MPHSGFVGDIGEAFLCRAVLYTTLARILALDWRRRHLFAPIASKRNAGSTGGEAASTSVSNSATGRTGLTSKTCGASATYS